MSDQPKEENNEAPDGEETVDPYGPTQVDPKRAFEMGAETPDAHAVPAHWSPPEPEVLDPLFPDYDLLELIGRGGMGAVYRGVQKSLDRPVAIKVLPPEMAEADPSFAARFEREAKSMARLDHPNIVHVYDFGRTGAGHWFIVMEFVDGMDFHQLIRSGELDQTGALNAVSQICDALEYAHAQGYVHRDIKPANIFINQGGILKVGDFGLAKMIEGEAGETTIREPQPMLTQTGISMGTPDYCSPEQLEGRHIDHRADIYSLGVMFYEMLTRELPRGNFPPPSKKVQVDVRIDDVVLRAMESEPEMRYSTAGEMRTEVDAVRTGETALSEPLPVAEESRTAAPPAKSKGSRAVAIVLIVLACLFALFVLGGVLVGFGFLLLTPTTVHMEPLDSAQEVPVREITQAPQATTAERYGLPALHGELRPIPGTAGWRSEEPGEVIGFAISPEFQNIGKGELPPAISEIPEDLDDAVAVYLSYNQHYAAAIRSDGSVVFWGDIEKLREVPEGLRDVVALWLNGGTNGGLALHRNGKVTGWGAEAVASETGLDQIAAIRGSRGGFYLITSDGRLHTFGFSDYLGLATPPERATDLVALFSNYARPSYVIALRRDGELVRWGDWSGHEHLTENLLVPENMPPVRSIADLRSVITDEGAAVSWPASGNPKFPTRFADQVEVMAANSQIARLPNRQWTSPDRTVREIVEKEAAGCTQIHTMNNDWALAIRPKSSKPEIELNAEPSEKSSLNPVAQQSEVERIVRSLSSTATKDAPFSNTLGMAFVPVPIPNGPTGGQRVLFSKWETRVSDFRAFAEATNCDWPAPEFEQGDDHPAVNVSWEDAVAFCEWLTEREREAGTIGSNERYRLPSDHEWSCAVEIGHLEDPDASPISKSPPKMDRPPPGTDTAVKGYPMGDKVYGGFSNAAGEETKAAGLSNNIVHGMKDGYAATAPVGNYKPNRFGLFDISGNVWEWCEDAIDPDSRFTRVRRGACWKTVFIPEMRSARREGAVQDTRSDLNGFRCVLNSE